LQPGAAHARARRLLAPGAGTWSRVTHPTAVRCESRVGQHAPYRARAGLACVRLTTGQSSIREAALQVTLRCRTKGKFDTIPHWPVFLDFYCCTSQSHHTPRAVTRR